VIKKHGKKPEYNIKVSEVTHPVEVSGGKDMWKEYE